ncbi:MAG: sensor domain-containing diguanylate cyclase [Burkholderiaceae bacterium]|nr:sensor domain-containing diguanylate cyclase [Burkholderiaceae bacterium]
MTLTDAHDFETAGAKALTLLRKRYGYDLWMITRREGDDLITLQAEGGAPSAKAGMVSTWSDSLCYRMASKKVPLIAPIVANQPELRDAPLAKAHEIKAYIGMPLTTAEGEFFGSLCAFDGAEQPLLPADDQELIELVAAMLTSMLRYELQLTQSRRHAERLAVDAQTDALTGLYNRRAWDDLLEKEEERCRRYGHPAAVVALDLNGLKLANDTLGHAAGDELIKRAAAALRSAARNVDIVARLGGDEFGILAVECDAAGAGALRRRIDVSLASAGVSAACGLAVRKPSEGLLAASQAADRLMYDDKRAMKALGQPGISA